MPRAVADNLPLLKVVDGKEGEEKAEVHVAEKRWKDAHAFEREQRIDCESGSHDHGYDQ